MTLLDRWHTLLNMPKYDEAWHRQDLADEMAEYHEATGIIDTWSELSDVAYTYTRARWSAHHGIAWPLSRLQFVIGLIYMFPKYTLRWRFFRRLGRRIDPTLCINEVRNPRKIEKLHTIAEKYHIEPAAFKQEAQRMLRVHWLLK